MPSRLVLVAIIGLFGLNGCAASRQRLAAPVDLCGKRGIILTVDGAGDFHASSAALEDAVAAERLPLAVVRFAWSHGLGRVVADQVDHEHAVCEGRRLAATICAWRQCQPQLGIHVVSHSAGSAVVLAATEALPANSVEHILLLAPSVSCCYDIRPALCCARQGVDVFFSHRDRVFLGVGTAVLGTADRCWGTCAAGRVGFEPILTSPADALLYEHKLRQHPWHPALTWTGNRGGHYGGYQQGHLRACVLPLLASP